MIEFTRIFSDQRYLFKCSKCEDVKECTSKWVKTYMHENKMEICVECMECGHGNIQTLTYSR